MSPVRRVWREIDAYRRRLRDGHVELVIVFAIAGILLTTADAPCSWLLGVTAPSLAGRFDTLSKGWRVLVAGLPCATLFLAATVGVPWWHARRGGDLRDGD